MIKIYSKGHPSVAYVYVDDLLVRIAELEQEVMEIADLDLLTTSQVINKIELMKDDLQGGKK